MGRANCRLPTPHFPTPSLLRVGQQIDLLHPSRVPRGLAARVLLVGGLPADVERLRERMAGRMPHNVEILGFVPREQVPQFLSAADVLVMPYTTKTLVYAGVDTTAVMNPMK